MGIEEIGAGLMIIIGLGFNIYKIYDARLVKGYCIKCEYAYGAGYRSTFEYMAENNGKWEKIISQAEEHNPFRPKEEKEYRLLVKKNCPERIYTLRTFIVQICVFSFLLCGGLVGYIL